uniref:3-dehydroquinate synthase n=1 Tax=uncultured marine group II/III euryarchaeote KM3_83_B05 TaxID=1456520 RepID=A0A075HRS6_9EURY|nr:3-dehydroquinate synthase [uncultured marine group II/III euryarchaeote KM3_83_B05]
MELWLSSKNGVGEHPADALVSTKEDSFPNWASEESEIRRYQVDNGAVTDCDGRTIGAFIQIENDEGQAAALEFVGLADWLLIDCPDWKMIPLENLVAAADQTSTKLAATISNSDQLQGATFALQRGVDALILPDDEGIWRVAQQLAAQRLSDSGEVKESSSIVMMESPELVKLQVMSVETGGVGDRVCVDLVQMLEIGEGVLVGSSAALLVLVHGETLSSQFVPPRPFRINAGPVHSYILMADGSTKYLSELVAGDEVLVVSPSGSRAVAVGRLKIEPRPLLLVRFNSTQYGEGQLFLQQAETVRLVLNLEKTASVTHLEAGMNILGATATAGRHIGQAISGDVEEK